MLQKVPKEIIFSLATKTQVIKMKSNEVFIREGEEIHSVYFVLSGRCDVIKTIKFKNKTKNLKIDTIGRGDIFGHHSVGKVSLFKIIKLI